MTNRAATLLSAAVIGGLAAVLLAAAPYAAAKAADECLTAPKGQAPQGAHWYYRIDRTTKRHCWYVRNESKGSQQASSSGAQPAASQSSVTQQESVANARAELPAAGPEQPMPTPPQSETPDTANSRNVAGDSNSSSPGGWVLASRWSNQADAESASAPMGAPDAAAIKQRLQTAAAKPPVDNSDGSSVWALVAALAGALAAAGIATAVIVRRAANKANEGKASHEVGQAIWRDDAREETPVAPNGDEPVMNWVRIAREIQEAQNPGREVEKLLARTAALADGIGIRLPHRLAAGPQRLADRHHDGADRH